MSLTKQEQNRLDVVGKIGEYVDTLLEENSCFTGSLQINFKDGELKDINCTERTRFGKD